MHEESYRQKLLNASEDKELTFQPKTTPYRSKKKPEKSESPGENRFYEEAERRKQRRALEILEREKIFKQEHPFQPKLSENPEGSWHRSGSPPFSERLYGNITDHQRRRKEKLDTIFKDTHPFKPTLNPKTIKIVLRKGKREGRSKSKEVEDDMRKRNALHQREDTSSHDRRKREQLRESDRLLHHLETPEVRSGEKRSKESRRSYTRHVTNDELFRKIFGILDADSKEFISRKDTVNIARVIPQAFKIIMKLFDEDNERTFSYEEFMNELLRKELLQKLEQVFVEISISS